MALILYLFINNKQYHPCFHPFLFFLPTRPADTVDSLRHSRPGTNIVFTSTIQEDQGATSVFLGKLKAAGQEYRRQEGCAAAAPGSHG
eukprot:scaffold3557_cov144-Skeletonema_marinoi.AAC.1